MASVPLEVQREIRRLEEERTRVAMPFIQLMVAARVVYPSSYTLLPDEYSLKETLHPELQKLQIEVERHIAYISDQYDKEIYSLARPYLERPSS
jgi:hypothetical protein